MPDPTKIIVDLSKVDTTSSKLMIKAMGNIGKGDLNTLINEVQGLHDIALREAKREAEEQVY
jgi:hypothetical protein